MLADFDTIETLKGRVSGPRDSASGLGWLVEQLEDESFEELERGRLAAQRARAELAIKDQERRKSA